MVTFEHKAHILVRLDGKHVGDIKEVEGGYAYYPKGKTEHGDIFPSSFQCMSDVKGDS